MEKHILIIEDEKDIRDAIAEGVTQAGFNVSVAENGVVGLEKALSEHPDLILLDIIMPLMDGHQVLEKLRQDIWGKNASVIMLTSMDDVKNIATAYTGDIADYVIKAHHSLDEIVQKVKVAIYSSKN
jgi:DNA-binding response OmpR family regulator